MIFNVPKLVKAGAWIEYKGNGAANWRGFRDHKGVVGVVAHHSVTPQKNNAAMEVEYIRHIHMNINKWGGIGYNIIITSEVVNGYAKAYLIGDLASIRAHTPNMKGTNGWQAGSGNWYLIGICMVGELHKYNPKPEQIKTFKAILEELVVNEDARFPHLKDMNGSLFSHKDFDSTECSGNFAWQKQAILNADISDPKPTPVEPEWKKGWTKKEEQFAPQKEYKLYSVVDGSVVQSYSADGKKVGTMYQKAGWRMTQWSYDNNKPNAFKVGELEWKPEPTPEPKPIEWSVRVNGNTMGTWHRDEARARKEYAEEVENVKKWEPIRPADVELWNSDKGKLEAHNQGVYYVEITDNTDQKYHSEAYLETAVAESAYELAKEIAKELAKQHKKDMIVSNKRMFTNGVEPISKEWIEYEEIPNVEYFLKYYPYQGVVKVAIYADYKQALDKFHELSNQLNQGDKIELLENNKLLNSYQKPMDRPDNVHKTIGDHLRSTVEIAAPVQAVTTFVGVIFAYYNPNMPMEVVLAFTGLFGIAFNVAYIVVSKWLNKVN